MQVIAKVKLFYGKVQNEGEQFTLKDVAHFEPRTMEKTAQPAPKAAKVVSQDDAAATLKAAADQQAADEEAARAEAQALLDAEANAKLDPAEQLARAEQAADKAAADKAAADKAAAGGTSEQDDTAARSVRRRRSVG